MRLMDITIIGSGYVGLTTGACFASLGNNVICFDVDTKKIELLNKGVMPFYEQGLKELVTENINAGRLVFTTDGERAIQKSRIIFITVGTPSKENGDVDLSYILSAAETIGKHINGYKIIVGKSTVPLGTIEKIREKIKEKIKEKTKEKIISRINDGTEKTKGGTSDSIDFDVVSNPEFLSEGNAVQDFLNPDRIVIGIDNERPKEDMARLYKPMEKAGKPILIVDIRSAELIKYASNAMLAARISFMNELSHLCDATGADINKVAYGVGLDSRIGARFLQAGIGYGGSCFPKDVKAIAHMQSKHNCPSLMIDAIIRMNDLQKKYMLPKISKAFPNLEGKRIAVWGLAFKPKTDDMREAPSVEIVDYLLRKGCLVRVYDPLAIKNAQRIFRTIEYGKDPYDTLKDCDALVICTECDEFKDIDLEKVKASLKGKHIFDGRNIYEPKEIMSKGLIYAGVGRL